ncbi:MAG: hypothetical protein ACLFTP_10805 [Rhodosalinus sp.]
MTDLSPRSFGRGGWGVVDGAGELVAGPYSCVYTAIGAAARLERQARERTRPCLTCGATFRSQGAHHRMCGPCRTRAKRLG